MLKIPESIETVSVSFHPSYAMRGMPQAWASIYTAIARAKQAALVGTTPSRDWRFDLQPTPGALNKYLRAAKGPIAVDIETPRDRSTVIELCAVSARPGEALSFPWTAEYIDVMATLCNTSVPLIGHNFAYDELAFLANGLEMTNPIIDTIQAQALLTPPFREAKKRRWLALSTSVLRMLSGMPYWKDFDDPKTEAFYKVAFPNVPHWMYPRLYNAMDAMLDYLLWMAQRELLEREGMLGLFRDYIMPAAPVLIRLEHKGIKIDEVARKTMKDIEQKQVDFLGNSVKKFAADFHQNRLGGMADRLVDMETVIRIRSTPDPLIACGKHPTYGGITAPRSKTCKACRYVYDHTPASREAVKIIRGKRTKLKTKLKQTGPEFKPDNDFHWRALLFEPIGLNLMPTEFTPKGLPVVKAEAIEELQMRYPQVEVLKHRVDLQHSLHRLNGPLSIPVDAGGYAHVAFAMHRTENGRLSTGHDDDEDDKVRVSPAGNLQNQEDYIRRMFVADEGYALVERDWSQIELRVMAWEARDMDLLQALADGIDIHAANAAAIFGCTEEDSKTFLVPFMGRKVPARWACKRCTHGWDYGLGDRKCGRMYQPFAGATREAVVSYLTHKWEATRGQEGLSSTALWRRIHACERTKDPEGEKLKAWGRLYQQCNTLRAKEWRLAYFAKWYGLARYQRLVVHIVERDRYLRNPMGRKLRFYGFRKNYETGKWELQDREEALAFMPASTVGDMCKAVLPTMERAALDVGGRLFTTTHDSFLAQIPNRQDALKEYHRLTTPIMEQEWPQLGRVEPYGLFSCPSDITAGRNWGKQMDDNPYGLREYVSTGP